MVLRTGEGAEKASSQTVGWGGGWPSHPQHRARGHTRAGLQPTPPPLPYAQSPESDYLDAALITVMQIHLSEPEGESRARAPCDAAVGGAEWSGLPGCDLREGACPEAIV